VAHDDAGLTVAGEIEQRDGERLCSWRQSLRDERLAVMRVVEDACAIAEQEAIAEVPGKFCVVGGRHEIERADSTQVTPGHGVRWLAHAGQRLAFEAAIAHVAPVAE